MNKELQKLVLARLETMHDDLEIHMGGGAVLNKQDLIKKVQEEDAFGEQFAQMQLKYLQAMARGTLDQETTHHATRT